MKEPYKHIQSAHCENGVTVTLLKAQGFEFMSEPLAFGIGSGLFYIHIPLIKFNNGPAVSFRTMPGRIFKQTCKFLNIPYKTKRFRNPAKAQDFLDGLLSKNIITGCQTSVFYLSYLPVEYRFHFNAHNIVVYGKENDKYLISDTVMENPTEISSEELNKARFAKGMYAPRGHLYYIEESVVPDVQTVKSAIIKGIRRNVRDMLYIPGSVGGVTGIKYTAQKIRKWRQRLGERKAGQYLGQIVRMQEEIGTGGGGFRYIYAAFLQEAESYFEKGIFNETSEDFTKAGNLWRDAASKMAGVYRGKNTSQAYFNEIADLLEEIFNLEKSAFKKLSATAKQIKQNRF